MLLSLKQFTTITKDKFSRRKHSCQKQKTKINRITIGSTKNLI